MYKQVQRFSIRKLTIGAASVLIGLAFFAVGRGQEVEADTVQSDQQETVVNKQSDESSSAKAVLAKVTANSSASDAQQGQKANASGQTDEQKNDVKADNNSEANNEAASKQQKADSAEKAASAEQKSIAKQKAKKDDSSSENTFDVKKLSKGEADPSSLAENKAKDDQPVVAHKVTRTINIHNLDNTVNSTVQEIDYDNSGKIIGNKHSTEDEFDEFDFSIPAGYDAILSYTYSNGNIQEPTEIPAGNPGKIGIQYSSRDFSNNYVDITIDVNFEKHVAKRIIRTIQVTGADGQTHSTNYEVDFDNEHQPMNGQDEFPVFDTHTINVPEGYMLTFTGVITNNSAEYAPYYSNGTITAHKVAFGDKNELYIFKVVKEASAKVTLINDLDGKPIRWNNREVSKDYDASTGVLTIYADLAKGIKSGLPPVFAGYILQNPEAINSITNGSSNVVLHFLPLSDTLIQYVDADTNRTIYSFIISSYNSTPAFTDQYGHHNASRVMGEAFTLPDYKLVSPSDQVIKEVGQVQGKNNPNYIVITFKYRLRNKNVVPRFSNAPAIKPAPFNTLDYGSNAQNNKRVEEQKIKYENQGFQEISRNNFHDDDEPSNVYEGILHNYFNPNQPVTIHFVDENGHEIKPDQILASNPDNDDQSNHGVNYAKNWFPKGDWTAIPATIDGYTVELSKTEGPTSGIYSLIPQEVTFVYKKNAQPTNPQPTNPQPTNPQPTSPQPTSPTPTTPQPTQPTTPAPKPQVQPSEPGGNVKPHSGKTPTKPSKSVVKKTTKPAPAPIKNVKPKSGSMLKRPNVPAQTSHQVSHQVVTKQANKAKVNAKTLPHTGENRSSALGLIGLTLAAIAGLFGLGIDRKRQH